MKSLGEMADEYVTRFPIPADVVFTCDFTENTTIQIPKLGGAYIGYEKGPMILHCSVEDDLYEEKETDMKMNDATLEADKVRYLLNRLESEHFSKNGVLLKMFGMEDDNFPSSPRELLDRIERKQFVIPEDKMDSEVGNPIYLFKWCDPNKERDFVGYKAAFEELDVIFQDYYDQIKVKGSDAGLDILNSLKNWTPSSKAN